MGDTAVTIGNFDGVHAGHAALVRRARALVGRAGRVVVLAFDPHPASVLRPGAEPGRLTTFARRAELLRELGADVVERLEPTGEFLAQPPEVFIDSVVVGRYCPRFVVEGPDFHFGQHRAGNNVVLAALGASRGFVVDVVGPVPVALTDQSVVTASSTLVRWLLARGRVRDAAFVLGRAHQIEGVVVPGARRGRTIGVPTANIDSPCVAPGAGVYAGLARLPDGRAFAAAVNVGEQPTFGSSVFRVEAHLLDARSGPEREGGGGGDFAPIAGLSEYGWSIRVDLIAFLRDAARFDTVHALTEQIGRDVARVRGLVRADQYRPVVHHHAREAVGA